MGEKKHTLLKVLGATAATGTAAYAGIGYYVFRNIFDLEHSKIYSNNIVKNEYSDEVEEWYRHSDKNDEFIDSYDGLKLHAIRIANWSDSHKWVILVHGVNAYSGSMIRHMYEFDHAGFNVLALDERGYGMSEGAYTGLGWSEHYDLINWINYLINIDKKAEIVLYGTDLGASAVMHAVGDYIPANVKCAVEDGGFSGIREILLRGIREIAKVDGRLVLPSVNFYCKQMLHFSVGDVSLKHQLEHCTVPMLFIHATDDQIVPVSMMYDNYYACSSEKDMFTVDCAGFGECKNDPDYFRNILEFVNKYI